jgi:predicted phage-related endonuclease
MNIIELKQGSDEWLMFRHLHHNASEAAAMLGLDPKTSRNQLLKMRAAGAEKEFTSYVQTHILDHGHDVEVKARAIIEEEIGEDLFPVFASDDDLYLYASFDGLNLDGSIGFEHKQWNDILAAAIASGMIPDSHMPQLQQQLMISGAEKIIFVVSDGTATKRAMVDVYPDHGWWDRINNGWKQFEKDLQSYTPAIEPEPVTAEVMIGLPALSIQTAGEISIRSNLELFGLKLKEFVGSIDMKPSTDQGFADAEAAVKMLQKAEESLKAAEASALAQTVSVEEMRRTVALYAETARKTRLALEKMVKERKEQLKGENIQSARSAFSEHVRSLEIEIAPIRLVIESPDFVGAIKGLRSIDSLQNALDTTLANAKIAADVAAREIRKKQTWLEENAKDHMMLFADIQTVIQKPWDDFRLLVQSRIDQRKKDDEARLEAERERIRGEERKRTEAAVQVLKNEPDPIPTTPISPGGRIQTHNGFVPEREISIVDRISFLRAVGNGLIPDSVVDINMEKVRLWASNISIGDLRDLGMDVEERSEKR